MGQRLGQHFLKNTRKIAKIVEALEIGDKETLFEIGPGHGELTKTILQKIAGTETRFFAIEKDAAMAKGLDRLIKEPNFEVIEGDAIEKLPVVTAEAKNYKIFGNIPYYITGRLLRTIGELKPAPKLVVLMLQKEVALRIAAKPPKMNLLAAAVQVWAEPEVIDIIPRNDFDPPPKVDSAVIRLNAGDKAGKFSENYYELLRALFKQPRKTIINNLKNFRNLGRNDVSDRLLEAGVDPAARPQNLSVENIKKMAEILYN
jgi:16S rRNA (adenine1518-N6/adenine1519-N6)-dimethyltransferase